MYAPERQRLIAEVVANHGRASVADLAERLGVTPETVRRDLDALETTGALRRVHGGAVAADRDATTERPLGEREGEHLRQKRAAADAAMRFIPSNARCSVLLDAGSTTAVIAERLAAMPARSVEGLTVICNSFQIIRRLAAHPSIGIVTLGGRLRSVTGAAVGPITLDQLGALRPDVAIVGTNGISADFGCSTPDPDEAAVKRAMVRSAARRIIAADSSKFDETSFVRFASLDDLDAVATDEAPTGDLAAALAVAGVEVVTP
ncbi:D-beta-D-heptose 1-phosphate adenosyltransferase [Pseudoclavibacter endophyticus]|uniref:Lactose phosphotransferase system repressor n=1 Tax=Pseudoclavibacter endophyticus TaxID=1778590 RepID=A0A6H9WBK9_9MICO|nr:DeoR/GlpR family DNA-binding transcription regulator [Pseudoclavibacter endophyticus]KAB1648043.1 DeoR/GlpR transcriptional regulator [Pseudoclavibacter endophyticus]GGA69232.1 D-beta-D-heptose 1-phosphate adenosyltransferase [Pseudoclavibacter endophyticus]